MTEPFPGAGSATVAGRNPSMAAIEKSLAKLGKSIDQSGKTWLKMGKEMDPIAKGMNESFQGMQGKASAVQKIIGMAMDTMAVGVAQSKKELVGAFKKLIQEGDIPGFLQGLVDMSPFKKFMNLAAFAEPWLVAFQPLNDILSMIADFASQAIATDPEFMNFIQHLPDYMPQFQEFGRRFADLILKVIDYDWSKVIDMFDRMIGFIETFTNVFDWFRAVGDEIGDFFTGNWQNLQRPFDQGVAKGGNVMNVNFNAPIMSEAGASYAVNQTRRYFESWA